MLNLWTRSILTAFIIFSSVILNPHVNAASLTELENEKKSIDEKKSNIQSNIHEKETALIENSSQIDAILSQIQTMNNEIYSLDEEIMPLESFIIQTMEEIETYHNSLIGLENMTADRDVILRERIRAIQVNSGPVTYFDVLIGASSFSDFLDRFTSVTALLDADRSIMKQQMADHEQLQQIKSQIDQILVKQKDQKSQLKDVRASLAKLKDEKDRLIDVLESIQKHVTNEKNDLQIAYDESHKMSEVVEQSILAEQQRVFQEDQKRTSSAFCQSNGEVNTNELGTKFSDSGVFSGKEQLFIDIAKEHSIDPILMAAIAFQETGKGTSNAVVLYNNPGGLMDPASNWLSLLQFESLEDGLYSMAKTLSRLILKEGRVTIQELGSAYAPIGADNDPLGLNDYWVPNVTKHVAAFGGLTMNCESQISYPSESSTNGKWASPASGTLSFQFGWRTHPITIKGTQKQHRGLDIANSEGTPVAAAGSGVITQAGWHSSYGNMIMITHVLDGQAFTTVYAHLSVIRVKEGQQIRMGELIGNMGSTGLSTGPHLHFEFHEGYYSTSGPSAVNPLRYVAF